MRINNNLMAMNTHRQLGMGQANGAKSMERLSSGLRINRAGDDAAGLAISEKMRGQIRGLNQASRNSQDAISMIQTAEGALSETQSILQRMKELATQAANGTNTETERDAIQKEINQLTSEINRIGNTTEFNSKSLLKGAANKSDVGATVTAGTAAVDAVNAVKAVFDTGAFSAAFADGDDFTLDFMGVTLTVNVEDGVAGGTGLVAGPTATAATLNIDSAAGGSYDALDEQMAAIVSALDTWKGTAGSPIADFTFAVNGGSNGITMTSPASAGASNNAEVITFTHTGTGAQTMANTTNGAQLTTSGVDAVAAVAQSNDLTFDKVPTEGSSFSVAGKTVAFYDSTSGKYADASAAQTALGANSVIDINGKNTSEIAAAVAALDFTNAGNGATATAVGNKVTFTAETTGTAAASNVDITTADAYAGSKSVLTAGNAADANASGDTFAMTVVVGSKAFTVDTSTNGLARNYSDTDTYGSADQTAVINALSNAVASDGTKLSDVVDISFVNGTNQNLKLEAKDVGTDNIQIITTGTDTNIRSALGLASSNETGTAGTDAYTDGGTDFSETFQVGANKGQSFNMTVGDMRAGALGITGTSAGADHATVADAKFTLTKDVTDGTSSTATEYALDVSTTESASAAIEVLDNAIQTVSAERSKLGSYQNRLEHTIKNLDTSAENLTAAESRIRDVDMAKEMMEFTKNNILQQAAQAMLAQANQAPQGVLQLLR